ncbi:MAG: hypothetical protein ACTS9Y_00630 [Methylophilus sp.]|uniref:hypothetical protein n=1 Tax=Methylophilus sp. TaxID=29541 RepID=UPI003FA03DFA
MFDFKTIMNKYRIFIKAMDQVSFGYWFCIVAVCWLVSMIFSAMTYVAFKGAYLLASRVMDVSKLPFWVSNLDFSIIFGITFTYWIYRGIVFVYLAHTEDEN